MRREPNTLRPVHPGEILLEEFLIPLGITMNRLALDLRVPANRISEIVHGRRAVTPDTALRLARYFHTTPRFWMNLQVNYDLAKSEKEHSKTIKKAVQPLDSVVART